MDLKSLSKKQKILLLATVILILAIPLTLYLVKQTQIFKPRAQELPLASQNTEKKAEQLTLELIKGESRLTQGRAPLENEPEKTLDQVAAERKSAMLELARSNPNQFLRVAITPEIRDTLSSDVAVNVEKKEVREGILEVIHGDNFESKKSEMFYILKTSRENISLYSPKEFQELKSNTRIRVEGLKLDNVMVLEKPEKNLTVTAENAAPREGGNRGNVLDETHGDQKVAVILVNFQDNSATPWTREYAKDLVFNKPDSVNSYYKEASYNQTGLSGDVFGWYTINSSSQYQVNHCGYNDLEKLFSDAVAASDPDINFRDFTRVVVAFPNLGSCGFGGWGNIGYTNFTSAEGAIVASKAWINGESSMTTGVVAHELGHNFGLHHARSYSCSSGVAGGRCTRQEYGDPFDVMGESGLLGHFNAPHKAYLNWFAPSEIQTVTASGRFTIHPLESASSGIKLLKVPKEISANNIVNKWYYLEYRQPVGFDKNFVQYNSEENIQRLQNGLVVHFEALGPARQLSYYTDLLDMTPDTQSFSDSPIRVGENYLDPTTEAGFTPVEKVNSGIVVNVRMPARKCIRANPTLDISPTSNTGAPGQRQYYFVTVTNNDNSFCTAPSTYNFEYSISSNNPSANTASWTYQLFSSNSQAISSLTLNPGETKNLQFILTSPQTPDGYYDIGIKMVNNTNPSVTDSVTATYIVAGNRPCATPRPSFSSNAGGEPSPTTIIANPCPSPTVTSSPFPTASPTPNQPPTASITGPTTWTKGIPVTFNAVFKDSNRNLARGEIYLMRTDAQPFADNCPNNDIVGSACRLRAIGINGDGVENENLSATISPSPGQYFVFVQAYDSAGARCSAAYQNLEPDWSDCGDNDFIILTVL